MEGRIIARPPVVNDAASTSSLAQAFLNKAASFLAILVAAPVRGVLEGWSCAYGGGRKSRSRWRGRNMTDIQIIGDVFTLTRTPKGPKRVSSSEAVEQRHHLFD